MKNKKEQLAILTKEELISLQKLSAADIKVYLALALHRNGYGLAYPSVTTISAISGSTRATVLRSISKLKEKSLIEARGKTYTGVIKYCVGGIETDTGNETDTGIETDTGEVSKRIRGGIETDTGGVSERIPRTAKRTTKRTTNLTASTNTSKLAETEDEKLFVLLWEKWKPVHLWEHPFPLIRYRDIRAKITDRDMCNELQCIDLFLLYNSGSGRMIWGKKQFLNSGLLNWLKSDTPSNNKSIAKYRPYLSKMICIPVQHVEFQPPKEEAPKIANTTDLKSLGLSLHLENVLHAFIGLSSYEERWIFIEARRDEIKINPDEMKTLKQSESEQIQDFILLME